MFLGLELKNKTKYLSMSFVPENLKTGADRMAKYI